MYEKAETRQAVPKQAGRPGLLRVLVADDHLLYRRGVMRALGARPQDFWLVGEAADGNQALERIEALEPHVAVLDLRMPGLDGIEVCSRLRDGRPQLDTKAILLSAFDDPELVAGAIEAGAAGYLDKQVSHAELCDAIKLVGAGGIAYTHRTAPGLVKRLEQAFG